MHEALLHNMELIQRLSMVEGMCDITFRHKPPLLGVRISAHIEAALMYGASAKRMMDEYRRVRLKNGGEFNIEDVWVVVPLPKGEPSEAELAEVTMADGEAEVTPGVSLRQMTREIYHCPDDDSAEQMLRRVLAA